MRRAGAPLGILAVNVLISGIVAGTAVWSGPFTSSRAPAPPAAVTRPWHLAWRAENAFPNTTRTTQTCRFAALLTAYGDFVRAEFSSPVVPGKGYTIYSASIALSSGYGLSTVSASSQPLTFGGKASLTVLPGAVVLGDHLHPNSAGERHGNLVISGQNETFTLARG